MDNNFTGFYQGANQVFDTLKLNVGKKVCVYMTFAISEEWRNKSFSGIIENAGNDHLLLSDPTLGKWYLLPIIYIDFIEFDEKINYNH